MDDVDVDAVKYQIEQDNDKTLDAAVPSSIPDPQDLPDVENTIMESDDDEVSDSEEFKSMPQQLGKFEESKQNQGLGNFQPSFNTLQVKKSVIKSADLDQQAQSETQLLSRNISVCRPSIMSDVLTKDDFCEGYIEKQSPSFHKMWQKRYFVLKDRMLFYYKIKQDYDENKSCKGVINFQQISVNPTFNQGELKITLTMDGSTRIFELKAPNMADFLMWQGKLQHAIDLSLGKIKGLSLVDYSDDINQLFEFWRFLRVPENIFIAQADVGDIILCLQKKKFSLANRLQAIEEICLLVKLVTDEDQFGVAFPQEQLYVLRAGTTKQQAVILQKWDDFRIYKSVKFSECWYRHLYCERNANFVENTQRFIQKIREKTFYKKEAGSNKRRLYTSAELIAKYYKNVGILARENQMVDQQQQPENAPQKKPVSERLSQNYGKLLKKSIDPAVRGPRNGNFEPKDFAQDTQQFLDMLGNARFGVEQTIMFHEKEIKEKLNNIYDHVKSQEDIIIMKTKQKWESDQVLSRISEKEIEHTMKIARKGKDDPLPKEAQFGNGEDDGKEDEEDDNE